MNQTWDLGDVGVSGGPFPDNTPKTSEPNILFISFFPKTESTMKSFLSSLFLLLVVLCSVSFALVPNQSCGNSGDGPNLWVDWVTNYSPVSYWDNHKQVAAELLHKHKREHPYAEETRFDLRPYVINAPEGWAFFLNVIGDFKLCPDRACYSFIGGLEPMPPSNSSSCDTRLNSYDETQTQIDFINCIYDNNMDPSQCPPLNFNDFGSGFEVIYKYGFNETAGEVVFFGTGRGVTTDGLYDLVLQETIAPDYVAPLELFYNISTGACLTTYTTPIVYEVLLNPPFWKKENKD